MTALSELLARANVQGWSSREIARRAEKNGHKLSYASASVYMGGRHGAPTEAVLTAFSDVLNVPIDQLRKAAGVPTGTGTPWAPPVEANRLDLRQRRALEELIRSMVMSEDNGQDDDHDRHHSTPQDRDDAGSVPVAGDAQPDGVTPESRDHAAAGERELYPWETGEFTLAAKRGRNRGREMRERQDRDAEDGGA
ncbi:hypothetical protein BRM3_09095 [Brachybacterium huguangmaarense]|uniref:HTH cro/C1-type domain-containing protein n=1 Tax=Brachybacterium huguangmaarense TaxID=1652028 RepID=A0ABY6FXZ9_9MICO|nr:hypothetical protein [Brachybacterium huguangmaarense]UYG15801.1 hypothetical protein BRM3_09095 [Brachybacterium huguangmaarense]